MLGVLLEAAATQRAVPSTEYLKNEVGWLICNLLQKTRVLGSSLPGFVRESIRMSLFMQRDTSIWWSPHGCHGPAWSKPCLRIGLSLSECVESSRSFSPQLRHLCLGDGEPCAPRDSYPPNGHSEPQHTQVPARHEKQAFPENLRRNHANQHQCT